MGQEGNDGEYDTDDSEDLADVGAVVGDAAESEDRGDDGDEEEDDSPVDHGNPFWMEVMAPGAARELVVTETGGSGPAMTDGNEYFL